MPRKWRKNTSRENRLEELGRVDAEKAYTKKGKRNLKDEKKRICLLYTSPSPRDLSTSRMPSSA